MLPAGEIEVASLLARFNREFPGIEVGLREGTAAEVLELLEHDRLDVAFTLVAGGVAEGIEALRISEEEVVAAFPPGTAPARDRVGAADLAGLPLATPRSGSAIKAVADEFFAGTGEPFSVSLESGDPYLIRCLVSAGFGAAVLPASLCRREGPPVETRPFHPRYTFRST